MPKQRPDITVTITPEEQDEIVRLYTEPRPDGKTRSPSTVAQCSAACRQVVTQVLLENDVALRKRGGGSAPFFGPEEQADVYDRAKRGETLGAIAEDYGTSRPTVAFAVHREEKRLLIEAAKKAGLDVSVEVL
ncbi:MAG: hypothetical protein AAFQ53_11305 [Bacteroidota bacterium]